MDLHSLHGPTGPWSKTVCPRGRLGHGRQFGTLNPTSDLNSRRSIPSNKSSIAREHQNYAIPPEVFESLLSMQGVVRSTMFVLTRFPSTTPKLGIHHDGSVPRQVASELDIAGPDSRPAAKYATLCIDRLQSHCDVLASTTRTVQN